VFVLVIISAASVANVAFAHAAADWKVEAGKHFQKAGEYTVRIRNTRFQDAIDAWGKPSSCRVAGPNNHAVAGWAERGIWVDLWTYGLMPETENGCISPDLIHVSEIRLTDRRWTTAFGLRVGDPTTKLRRLYPRAQYHDSRSRANFGRTEYWLVTKHMTCLGECNAYEQAHGVDAPQLTAEVRNGRVVAFWLPVFGQGE
jgi:hypothetical protein